MTFSFAWYFPFLQGVCVGFTRLLSCKMPTHGDSLLLTAICLNNVEEDKEEILPVRQPIVASDGTSGSSHVFSTPKSQATTQVGEEKGARGCRKLVCFVFVTWTTFVEGLWGKWMEMVAERLDFALASMGSADTVLIVRTRLLLKITPITSRRPKPTLLDCTLR
jgi:hypothetical protein